MAQVTKCDICGAEGAHQVQTHVVIYDIVVPGQPTAHGEQAYACADHEAETIVTLMDYSLLMLREQAPYQVQMLEAEAERNEADTPEAYEKAEGKRLAAFRAGTKKADARKADLPKKLRAARKRA